MGYLNSKNYIKIIKFENIIKQELRLTTIIHSSVPGYNDMMLDSRKETKPLKTLEEIEKEGQKWHTNG